MYTVRRCYNRQSERCGDVLFDRSVRQLLIQLGLSTEEIVRPEIPQYQISIRHRWRDATLTVTGRTWICAGTFGPDAENAAGIYSGDTTAAGS